MFAGVQATQVPVVAAQTKGTAQPASLTHWTQRPGGVPVSQVGTGAEQSVLAVQPPLPGTAQLPGAPVVTLQVWPVGQPFRIGAALQPGTQMPTGPLQMRPELIPPQSLSPLASEQPQRPKAVRQRGFGPPQRELSVAEHSEHAPAMAPVVWQTGRAGSVQLGDPSPAQGTQVRVVGEQRGDAPPQSALLTQPTQTPTPEVRSQSGRATPHAVRLVAEHCAHTPSA